MDALEVEHPDQIVPPAETQWQIVLPALAVALVLCVLGVLGLGVLSYWGAAADGNGVNACRENLQTVAITILGGFLALLKVRA